MRILTPDAQFEGPPDIEVAAARDLGVHEAVFRVYRVDDAALVPAEEWSSCDAATVWHGVDVTADVIGRLDRCRIIVRVGVGYDNVNVAAAGARGIAVSNVPDYGTTDIADTTIAMLLAFKRGVVTYDKNLRADPVGNWRADAAPVAGRLRGLRFGIVGCGRIGTATMLRARAFELEVAFYDPYLPTGAELGLGCGRFRTLEELLAWADVVSLHTPLTDETRGMIDARAIASMKDGAILINTARGGIVDLDAVHEGLVNGRLAAAGLDVLPVEPPEPHPLIDAYRKGEDWVSGRLMLSPHAAWYSESSRHDLRRKSVTTALNYLTSGELRDCVNADALRPRDPASAKA
ncbi:MAG: C-terminal binding protein [Alphaproteobacteria bacterium]